MADEATPAVGASSPGPSVAGGDGGSGEVTRLRAENTKLMQRNAEIEKYAERAVPMVKITQALLAAPGGKEVIEKLEKGEPLTVAEEKKAAKAAETATAEGEAPLTVGAAKVLFESMVNDATSKFGETVAAERNAEKSVEALEAKATKELEGYQDLKNDPTFKGWVAATIEQIKAKKLVVPEGEDDVYYFAMKTAYNIAHALQGKPVVGKGETERVAEALAAGGSKPSSATSTSGSNDVPKGMEAEIERIRGYGSRQIAGMSFNKPRG